MAEWKGRVWREDKFWVVMIDELDAATQAYSRDDARFKAIDLVRRASGDADPQVTLRLVDPPDDDATS